MADAQASTEFEGMTAEVITVSDRSAAGVRPDAAGPAVRALLEARGLEVRSVSVVPDDQGAIEGAIRAAADADAALCVTCGGTGMSPRDVTPEATRAVCDRLVPGLAEAMRASSARITPTAWLSRGVAGTLGRTLVVNVPGSPKASVENLEAILAPLAHALRTLRSAPSSRGAGAADLTSCRYALFDFDGTLADTAPGIVEAATETLAAWGMTHEQMGDVARLVGPALPGAFRLVYGVSEADDAELTARYRARYEQLGPESYPLFAGMRTLLAQLRAAGWHLAVATSKRQYRCVAMLEALGVHDEFEVICGQADGVKDKPTLIGRALRELGAPADMAVMVGDRGFDVEGATANGIACAGVHFGSTPRSELEDAGATVVVDSVGELAEALLGAGAAADAVRAAAADFSTRPCILFDFDGTLADTKAGIIRVARQVLAEEGMSDEEMGDLSRLVGPPFPAAFTQIYGMPPEEAERVGVRYRGLYRALGPETHPLFPGIAELLRSLRAQGRRLVVTTSKGQDLATSFLADNGVEDVFEAIVGKLDPAHSSKAELVARSLEALGCSADDAVMVGDRFYDVEGAAAHGVPCVGVYLGDTAPAGELERAGAAACVHSVAELGRVLGA